jgi:hypothetical protein
MKLASLALRVGHCIRVTQNIWVITNSDIKNYNSIFVKKNINRNSGSGYLKPFWVPDISIY